MILSGFSDEAGQAIETQIEATRRLGWRHLDLRQVGGRPFFELPLDEVRRIADLLAAAGISVCGVGSAIANWSRPLEGSFEADLAEARALIPRMRALGVTRVRVMSYPPRGGDWFATNQGFDERVRRLRLIVAELAGAGLRPLHENCFNYGGMGWRHTLELLEAVPGLGLIFDTGNPAVSPDVASGDRERRQSPWEFYQQVRPRIDVLHVKDPIWRGHPPGEFWPRIDHVLPGDGEGEVRRIVTDLVRGGFAGPCVIEPHRKIDAPPGPEGDETRIGAYVAYGRRLEEILAEARA